MSRMKEKALFVGWVVDDATGEVYLQLPSDEGLGFVIADGDQTWQFPPFDSWTAIADDDSRITDQHRHDMEWILDEARNG